MQDKFCFSRAACLAHPTNKTILTIKWYNIIEIMLMYQEMGIGGVCSIMLADVRHLYLYASGMYSIGQAGPMQPCCWHCTGDAKAVQTCNETTPLHICITSVAQRARLYCCTSILGCCVLQGGPNHYMRRNAKMRTPFGEPWGQTRDLSRGCQQHQSAFFHIDEEAYYQRLQHLPTENVTDM